MENRLDRDCAVRHRRIEVDGCSIFYREAGRDDRPVVLLPHGYPSSSFQFRNFMPALANRWRVVAPDFPGFGYSDMPDHSGFAYTFEAYAGFLLRFTEVMNLRRYAIDLHDYGSQIGLRLAMKSTGARRRPYHPEWRYLCRSAGAQVQGSPRVLGQSDRGRSQEARRSSEPGRFSRADQPGSLDIGLVADAVTRAAGDRDHAHGESQSESRLVPPIPGIFAGTSAADADRLGDSGRIYA
ncbi:MAG: hypothetical protein K0S45_3608 [Nitrospira sp.]|nr:hypothetical protein [Nitrospira sp.]